MTGIGFQSSFHPAELQVRLMEIRRSSIENLAKVLMVNRGGSHRAMPSSGRPGAVDMYA